MNRFYLLGCVSFSIAGAGVLSATGCNALVDAGDYHVAQDTSGLDASPDAVVNTPDTSMPAHDATPEAAVDARVAVCGQGLPTTDARFKAVLTACVLSAGCDYQTVPWTISHCVTDDLLGAVPGLSTLQNVTKCADVTTATGRGYKTAAQSDCATTGAGYHCAGNQVEECFSDNTATYQDCAKLGGTCGTYAGTIDGGAVTFADCIVTPTCTGEGTVGCDTNGDLYTCRGGRGFGESCPTINAECSAGDKTCYYKGTSCTTQGETCSANAREACYGGTGVDNTLYRFDCSAAGLTCAPSGSATACLAPGCTAADATACKETCAPDGKTATFCIGGAKLNVDCSTFTGFTQCGLFGTNKDQAQCF